MTAAAENQTSEMASAATWLGFVMMCTGMFMAILDVPDAQRRGLR